MQICAIIFLLLSMYLKIFAILLLLLLHLWYSSIKVVVFISIPTDNSIMKDNELEYIGRIQSQYSSLSKSQKKIANYVFVNKHEISKYSITQLAKKLNTSTSSITRFCQALSFSGFSEFKVYVEKNLISSSFVENPISPGDETSTIIQKLLNISKSVSQDTLRLLNPDEIIHSVNDIIAARVINLYGQSGGYISACYAQQMLLRVGILSQAFNDNVDMSIAANTLGKEDVAIGFGYSGESKSVVNALTIAKKNKAKVIAITANPNSSMAKISDSVLFYSYNIPDDLQYLHLASICEIIILGVIQAEILRRPDSIDRLQASKTAVLQSRIK